MKRLDLTIQDLTNLEMAQILKRAEDRVENAVLNVKVGGRLENDVEIPSFPVAILLVVATENSFIKKRYALAEAKQAFSTLQEESSEKILSIARDFDWRIDVNRVPEISLEFVISFSDYLRNTAHLREREWKLVNRVLADGNVYLNKHDVSRLLQEEVRRRIEKSIDSAGQSKFPDEITRIAEKIKKLAADKMGAMEQEVFPKVVVQDAFPPCVRTLYEAASSGHHLSHVGRFTLTSFLVNVGMSSDKVAEVFKNFSDYNERLTRYQVEHIAGDRGSGTKYKPPKCDTLKTHSVCVGQDDLCRRIYHPLNYYMRKTKR
jgi:DNA primase large subunit